MEGLPATGTCRVCVVEDRKSGKLVPSCSFPVSEGMDIATHSNQAVAARKTIIELLLASHPDDCLYCPGNGTCVSSVTPRNWVSDRGVSRERGTE
jgi:NADH dehydrogenase/NADH:ubiquinone oxidoreductase subunit G